MDPKTFSIEDSVLIRLTGSKLYQFIETTVLRHDPMKTTLLATLPVISFIIGCSNPEMPQKTSNEEVGVNYGEIALVELAHRHFGEESTFFNEKISDAEGIVKACGEYYTSKDTSQRLLYIFSVEEQKTLKTNKLPEWERKCKGGWKPGTGR
ncbi:hypothetical protein ACN2C7_06445 [Caulobacter sp. ErkDOM-E]|uniref:hypothetical protein n=1 Tax=Caulobacter sp. ErkDOM-E TaxID=3402778 RepID=UPI003AF7659A